LEKDENLVKKTCRELNITQKELANTLGVSPNTISNWNKGKIDKINKVLLESMVYKKKFSELQDILKFSMN